MKKTILTTAITLALLLTGVSAAVSMKEIKATSQISEKPIEVTKPAESKYHRHCFFFADIDSSGYAKKATIRCYDGIISVTYYNGVTNVNFRFGSETFTESHVVQIYGFGGTHNWAGTVTNKDIAFAGFTLVCIVCKDSKDWHLPPSEWKESRQPNSVLPL